jgi:DNA-binding response OmpR family regulator
MLTVLVVEDDSDIRDLIAFRLTLAGYAVRLAEDGHSALAAAGAGGIDLVLLDVRMPGLDGLLVCRRLRTDPATADLPIILVTAAAQERDTAEGLAAGADDYIVKPFSPRELTQRIEAVLERRLAPAGR